MTHATVTAHKGHLVICLNTHTSIENEVATSLDNPGRFGQVIMSTSKHLGVSEEALALLKTVKRGRDGLGDIDWFSTANGDHAFSWIGGPYSIKKPEEIEGSREYVGSFVPIDILKTFCVIVPNDVPDGAKAAIDNPEDDEDDEG